MIFKMLKMLVIEDDNNVEHDDDQDDLDAMRRNEASKDWSIPDTIVLPKEEAWLEEKGISS